MIVFMIKHLFIFSIFFAPFLNCEWDPAVLSNVQNQKQLKAIEFLRVKSKVIIELKDSWCSEEKINLLMELTLLTKPKVCVEIGAFKGSSVLPVAVTLNYLRTGKIFAIDAWSNAVAIQYLNDNDPNKLWWSQIDMEDTHQNFKNLIKKWSLNRFCVEIPAPSFDASCLIPEQIDFLHIDGDYSEIGSLRDVEIYLPKVKSGGYILLSNFFIMVNREQPKIKAFCALCDGCDVIATIENDHAVLFKKK